MFFIELLTQKSVFLTNGRDRKVFGIKTFNFAVQIFLVYLGAGDYSHYSIQFSGDDSALVLALRGRRG